MTYELWSKSTRSIVGAFDSEPAALVAVREAVEVHGRAYAEGFALIRGDTRGRSRAIADGASLVDRALAAAPARHHVSA